MRSRNYLPLAVAYAFAGTIAWGSSAQAQPAPTEQETTTTTTTTTEAQPQPTADQPAPPPESATPAEIPPAPSVAQAPSYEKEEERLGEAGQLALSGDLELAMQYQNYSAPNGQDDPDANWQLTVAPAFDYFFAENMSIGGYFAFQYTDLDGDDNIKGWHVAPRFGYNIPFNDDVSLWLKVGVGYVRQTFDDGSDITEQKFRITAFTPFVFEPADHFFIGIGPNFYTDLISDREGDDGVKTTAVGFATEVGGYF